MYVLAQEQEDSRSAFCSTQASVGWTMPRCIGMNDLP